MSSDLANLLRAATGELARSLNTCLPGTVTSYDAGSQRASVQPMVRLTQPDGREESLPALNSVPVIWPRSGGASITLPVRPGDGCLILFSQRSLDEYKTSGQESAVQDPRMFDMSDAVAIMGFVSFGSGGGPADSIQIKLGSSTITVTENGVTIDADSVEVNAPQSTFNGNVQVAGNLGVTGNMNSQGPLNITGPSVTHNGVNVGASHVHSGVETGGGNTGVPH